MPEETAGTNQNTGAAQGTETLLTGSNVTAGTGAQQQGADGTQGTAATNQTETKDGEAAGAKDGQGTEQQPAGAPEKYEFKMPEGIALDEAQVKAFEPIARELNLTQDQAQKLVDLQIDFVKRTAQAQTETWSSTVKGWEDTTKADKEIGGANLEASLNAGKAFLKRYGTPELNTLLQTYGIGNHPEIIRAFAKAGKDMAEDKFHTGGPSSPAEGNHFFPKKTRA